MFFGAFGIWSNAAKCSPCISNSAFLLDETLPGTSTEATDRPSAHLTPFLTKLTKRRSGCAALRVQLIPFRVRLIRE